MVTCIFFHIQLLFWLNENNNVKQQLFSFLFLVTEWNIFVAQNLKALKALRSLNIYLFLNSENCVWVCVVDQTHQHYLCVNYFSTDRTLPNYVFIRSKGNDLRTATSSSSAHVDSDWAAGSDVAVQLCHHLLLHHTEGDYLSVWLIVCLSPYMSWYMFDWLQEHIIKHWMQSTR